MKIQKSPASTLQLRYAKILQDYQILWSAIITYWIALTVGLIIAHLTEKLVFNIFFVGIISTSTLITLLILFQLVSLKDRLVEIREEIE